PHEGGRAGGEGQIRPAALLGLDQELGDVHGSLPARRVVRRLSWSVRGSTWYCSPRRRMWATPRVMARKAARGTSRVKRWASAPWLVATPSPPTTRAPCSALPKAAAPTWEVARSSTRITSAGWRRVVAAPAGKSAAPSTWRKPGTMNDTVRSMVSVRRASLLAARARAEGGGGRGRGPPPAAPARPPG